MRYEAKFVSAWFLVLIAATACADPHTGPAQPDPGRQSPVSGPQAQPGAGDPQAPGQAPGHPVPRPPDGSVALPAGQLDATALPSGFPREVYTGNGGTVLYVKAEEGGCGHAVATAAEQSAQRVAIALSETPAQPGRMCTMDIRYPVVSVTLDAPLGERPVVLHKEPRDR